MRYSPLNWVLESNGVAVDPAKFVREVRAEMARAIESAQAENRHCAFLVASIDRLAMINDAYGFDAADEVVWVYGEICELSLRLCDYVNT